MSQKGTLPDYSTEKGPLPAYQASGDNPPAYSPYPVDQFLYSASAPPMPNYSVHPTTAPPVPNYTANPTTAPPMPNYTANPTTAPPMPNYTAHPTTAPPMPNYTAHPTMTPPMLTYQPANVIMPASPAINVSIQTSSMCAQLGPDPITTVCPNCRVTMKTVVTTEYGPKAWISCCILALLGFWAGCCLIPFCIDPLNYKIHNCSSCHAFIGRYKR